MSVYGAYIMGYGLYNMLYLFIINLYLICICKTYAFICINYLVFTAQAKGQTSNKSALIFRLYCKYILGIYILQLYQLT